MAADTLTPPPAIHFEPVQPSKLELDWADIPTIDLARYADESARPALARELHQAMTTVGFFLLKNHGISEAEIERHVDIGYTVLQNTPTEEKEELRARMESGSYRGFKLRKYMSMGGNVQDRIEHFNFFRDMKSQKFPKAMEPYKPEVTEFVKKIHGEILFKVFRLFANALDLPSETFVNKHKFELNDQSWFRYMAYYDEFSPEEEAKIKSVWLGGHSDFNTLTVLFSQPMSSLQVRDEQDQWRYVKHVPGGIIINCGAFMSWYTGGHFTAAKHRVHAPPDDQRNHVRMGLIYFAVPNDDEEIDTLTESPVLQRAGIQSMFRNLPNKVTSKSFSSARIKTIGKEKVLAEVGPEGGDRVEIVDGIPVPLYG